jgi:predicted phosphate transport protein (TIGR00153 family)
MAFSLLPREDSYFVSFSQMSEKIIEAAGILVEMTAGAYENYDAASKRIKSVEHECDEITHNITTKLNKSFITPFDREDIYTLAVSLDDVCDYIDAGSRAMVMYDIHDLNDYIKQFAVIIEKLAKAIHSAVSKLKDNNGLKQDLLEIQRLENEADEVYYKAIGYLFKNTSDPIEVIKLKEVYEILENATDRCERVGNIIESIMLKHN